MSTSTSNTRRQIEIAAEHVYTRVIQCLEGERAVIIVKAPPGSGKTYLLLKVVQALLKKKRRIAVATQTNAQADDVCKRLAAAPWNLQCYRFVGSGRKSETKTTGIIEVDKFDDLPMGSGVVVGTSAKWGFVEIKNHFDVLLVDEAWQMQWSQFIPLGRVAPRFVLIGDPGQIPPVVAVNASRWVTAQIPPHLPAPEIVCANDEIIPGIRPIELQLPASRRLPADTVDILQSFYDFGFLAWANPADRAVLCSRRNGDPIDRAIDLLADGSVCAVTRPTTDDPPPSDTDREMAELAVMIAERLVERKAKVQLLDDDNGNRERTLTGADIAIAATHRVMNQLIDRQLRSSTNLQDVRVDTPERWQGLERLVTIVVHPLSGVLKPSSFDLETGRLCVMASRHRGGLIVVGRDHIGDTLDGFIVSADQPIGRPDITGRGHHQHLAFWGSLESQNRIVHL